jgi:hypothetical protein
VGTGAGRLGRAGSGLFPGVTWAGPTRARVPSFRPLRYCGRPGRIDAVFTAKLLSKVDACLSQTPRCSGSLEFRLCLCRVQIPESPRPCQASCTVGRRGGRNMYCPPRGVSPVPAWRTPFPASGAAAAGATMPHPTILPPPRRGPRPFFQKEASRPGPAVWDSGYLLQAGSWAWRQAGGLVCRVSRGPLLGPAGPGRPLRPAGRPPAAGPQAAVVLVLSQPRLEWVVGFFP